ncbi:conserved hypothetical protein [Methylobacterium sp. 4-46]|uniref:DUF2141 domain-containing protein n=1 Tax=unclassified Methylobacterium TaxID=2615210 RepID=UPI000152DBAC|nr:MULTISPECIES: DUF2141 domain-containing protein [Methylobacterium]ACA19523.1 conserved hypothetical protein [Methylobacterium sp. 4-46]WFT78719.1 DUF2141 domain-containing protein [Methylobacterium nodulans]
MRAGAPRAALAALLAALVLPSGGAAAAELTVDVEGVQPGAGEVYVALCTGGLSEGSCRIGQNAPARAPALRFAFTQVPPGTYAVAVFQDLDGDGRLARTPLGLPREPYGFSNGAGRGGRPDFAAAAFPLAEPGAAIRVRLQRALPAAR